MQHVRTTTYKGEETREERITYVVGDATLLQARVDHVTELHEWYKREPEGAELVITPMADAVCPCIVFWPDGWTTYVYVCSA